MQNIILNSGHASQIIFPAIAIGLILSALAYVLRHPFIKEGAVNTKNIVAVAIGVMLTILITHLLPEIYAVDIKVNIFNFAQLNLSALVFLFSLLSFYILGWTTHDHEHDDEHEHHTHMHGHKETKSKSLPIMFVGQSVHSVADGVIIASSFAVNILLGIVTTIAISIHHIPMMSGVVMRNNSDSKNNFNKMFWMTIVSSSFMLLGLALFYFIKLEELSGLLISVAAASFLYVGAYDLTSYLREYDDKKIFKRVLFIFLGVAIGLMSQVFNGENLMKNNVSGTNSELKNQIINFKDLNLQEKREDKIIASLSTNKINSEIEYPADNQNVKNWALENYKNFLAESSADRELSEYDKNLYSYEATYGDMVETDKYKNYNYTVYTYTGGAHPLTSNISYIIKKENGNRVEKISDVYSVEVYKFLESYTRKDLKLQMKERGMGEMSDASWLNTGTEASSTDSVKGYLNYNSFSFNKDNLIINFGQYQVAPYAAGMFEVKVPLSEIKKFER